jgi:hypothetical protein
MLSSCYRLPNGGVGGPPSDLGTVYLIFKVRGFRRVSGSKRKLFLNREREIDG